MNIVKRLLEVPSWSTSRTSALVSGLVVLSLTPVAIIADTVNHALPWLDAATIRSFFIVSIGVLTVIFLVTLFVARRGYEGAWTSHFVMVPIAFGASILIWMFGGFSSGLLALYPGLVIGSSIIFGMRAGVFAFGLSLLLIGVIWALQDAGAIPFAPVILDRDLDIQRSTLYSAIIAFAVVAFTTICFGLILLTLHARQLQQEALDRSSRLIRRYVPSQLADRIISGDHPEVFKPERVKLTVFFSDLVGFTEIAEALEAEELSHVLNEYFSSMTAIASRHGGTLDELSGDAILIFFGAPVVTSDRDHAIRAIRMAIEMLGEIERLNAGWAGQGIAARLVARMGINTGVVTIGSFGSPDRMKYAALGKHVNLAARLQAICEPGKVLISHATWLLVHDELDCVSRGEAVLKGIQRPVQVYEPQAAPSSTETRRTERL